MIEEKPLIVDCSQENFISQVLPFSSLLSSYNTKWNGIRFELHRQPPGETLENSPLQHVITIPTHYVARLEQIVDNKVQGAPFSPTDITIAPSGLCSQCRWTQEIELMHLILDPKLVNCIAHESVEPDCVELMPHFIKSDPLIYQIGLALKTQLETNDSSSYLYAESAATFLAAHLLQHYSNRKHTLRTYEGGLPQDKLKQAIDYIQAHLTQDVSVEAIADYLGISRYYFCRLFKQSTGFSPHQYVIRCRVERAKQLLLQRKKSIADIAIACGFTHQSHLTRHFKRLLGVTPKTLLKS